MKNIKLLTLKQLEKMGFIFNKNGGWGDYEILYSKKKDEFCSEDRVFYCGVNDSTTCCGVDELGGFVIDYKKHYIKDAVKVFFDKFCNRFAISYLLKERQKKEIKFLKSIGFKQVSEFKGRTGSKLVCLYKYRQKKK